MSKHDVTESLETDPCLVVAVTPECSARWGMHPNGRPTLVIDYGGAQLMLEVAEPQDAEEFALGLALTALNYASHCRYLRGGCHG
jgi:hypothetical protein